MAIEINQAKDLVIKAGLELVEKGLIARTWGNVSARISDTQFVITPSGIPYEDLTPDKIVAVNIEDLEYEGDVKPSSEKGVHASAYIHHPEVDFVIHTHQTAASVVSIRSQDITGLDPEYAAVLGPKIPIAKYGISSTKTLRQNVDDCIAENKDCYAVLMKHHGTVCMGKDYDNAFAIADALENACNAEIARICKFISQNTSATAADLADVFTKYVVPAEYKDIPLTDLGCSVRNGDTFTLTMKDGSSYVCYAETGNCVDGIAPRVSMIHSAIYSNSDVKYISHFTDPEAVAVSKQNIPEPLYFDDFVQIAGFNVQNVGWDKSSYRTQAKEIGKASKGKNAVFVTGQGALCTASSEYDAKAVEMVLEKECKAHLFAGLINDATTIDLLGGMLERIVYVLKYSKQAEK